MPSQNTAMRSWLLWSPLVGAACGLAQVCLVYFDYLRLVVVNIHGGVSLDPVFRVLWLKALAATVVGVAACLCLVLIARMGRTRTALIRSVSIVAIGTLIMGTVARHVLVEKHGVPVADVLGTGISVIALSSFWLSVVRDRKTTVRPGPVRRGGRLQGHAGMD